MYVHFHFCILFKSLATYSFFKHLQTNEYGRTIFPGYIDNELVQSVASFETIQPVVEFCEPERQLEWAGHLSCHYPKACNSKQIDHSSLKPKIKPQNILRSKKIASWVSNLGIQWCCLPSTSVRPPSSLHDKLCSQSDKKFLSLGLFSSINYLIISCALEECTC